MNIVFCGMLLAGVLFSLATGRADAAQQALFDGGAQAVELCLSLAGAYAFFGGLLGVMRETGAADALARLLKRPLAALLRFAPGEEAALQDVSINLATNMLGMGSAATPAGLRAMRALAGGQLRRSEAQVDAVAHEAAATDARETQPVKPFGAGSGHGPATDARETQSVKPFGAGSGHSPATDARETQSVKPFGAGSEHSPATDAAAGQPAELFGTGSGPAASDAMILFLVINVTGVQLLPTTMIALRAQAGAANPADIVPATLAATTAATVAGVLACRIFARFWR